MSQNKIDTQALNEKLMKFVGFFVHEELKFENGKTEKIWRLGDTIYHINVNLVTNPTDQNSYLVPKLLEKNCGFVCGMFNKTGDTWARIYQKVPHQSRDKYFEVTEKDYCEATNKNLPLAFALACEKFVDSLSEK